MLILVPGRGAAAGLLEEGLVVVESHAGDAEEFGRDVRNCIASEEYRRLFPCTTLAEDSQARGRWHTAQGGGYYRGWGLLRASNTQPVLAMRFEAADGEQLNRYRAEMEAATGEEGRVSLY